MQATVPYTEIIGFNDAANEQMERMAADFGRLYRERNAALQEVSRAHHEALLHLSRAAEFRDDDTGVHIVRMGYLAWGLALRMGQSEPFAVLLRQTAPMALPLGIGIGAILGGGVGLAQRD
jgi:putative two-component system response regulator